MSASQPPSESTFRRKPQQQRSQQRVEKILEAAAAVFWEVGYDAATTHEIARRAHTAVGTLYRFFPNKLAIFHALEKQHRQSVDDIHTRLMSPEFVRQPLAQMIQQTVETYAIYFENLGPRVIYTHYYSHPELYAQYDEAVDQSYIKRFAIALRIRNATLSVAQSELIAEVCHRSFNALFVSALRSDPQHKASLYQELQKLLTHYLQGYDQTEAGLTAPATDTKPISTNVTSTTVTSNKVTPKQIKSQKVASKNLKTQKTPSRSSERQRKALEYIQAYSQLSIQNFESLYPELSRRTLQRDLKQLINQGLIQAKGETNQLIYQLAAPNA